jgi:hypothetical protein
VCSPSYGDHRAGQLQRRQQRLEVRHLVGLVPDLLLGQHHPGVGDRTQQVRRLAIAASGAADHLAIHRHLRQRRPAAAPPARALPGRLTRPRKLARPATPPGTGRRGSAHSPRQPATNRLLERIAVDAAADPPQRGLIRGHVQAGNRMPPRPQLLERALRGVGQPLPDRVE